MKERIALGFGDCIDYEIVWDSRVIEALIDEYAIHANELHDDRVVNSERELVISILGFLKTGSGGERFVASSDIIERFSARFAKKITLGGTSVRAAIAMRKLGYTSALHLVTVNDHVRRLIPHDSPYVCSSAQDSAYPHLIVQFGQGCRVRAGDIELCASRPNRIIYHNDANNIAMQLNEDFGELMAAAKVLLVSGFNAMQRADFLRARLAALLRMMERLPQDAIVYHEDSVYYDPSFRQLIHTALADRITIFSLNEDEMQGHLGRAVDLLDAEQVHTALRELHKLFPFPILVVHTMYWALAYGANATRMAAALKGGVTMATTRFCYGDDFTVAEYQKIEVLPPNPQGASAAAALHQLLGDQVCCVSVAQVEQANATTIGLGDAFIGGFLPLLV
ncbi:MAG: ADP-dependent glucokinase/phosphofructokinase [Caldilineaceae bacterium]